MPGYGSQDDNQGSLLNTMDSDDDLLDDADMADMEDEGFNLRIKAIWAAIITVLIDSIMFSIVLPSLAIFLQDFVAEDDNSYTLWLGLISAGHPFGQLAASPFASWCFNNFKTRMVMIGFIALFCVGALLYAVATSATMLLVSRIIQGVGDANLVVCRAYVGHVAQHKEKVKYMAFTSAAQGLGFLVGSTIGGLLSFVDFTMFGLTVNSNTAPGYFSFLIGLVNIFCCAYYMVDYDGPKKPATEKGSIQSGSGIPPNFTAVLILNVLFFFAIASFSTLLACTTVYLNVNYDWGTATISAIYAGGSILGVIAFKNMPTLNKYISERWMMAGGLGVAGVAQMAMGGFGMTQVGVVTWCIAAFVFFLAHPFAMACNLSLYAKIIGPAKENQGPYMGSITMMGSAASIGAPLWGTAILGAENFSGVWTFFSTGIYMALGAAAVFMFWHKFVPHPDSKNGGKAVVNKNYSAMEDQDMDVIAH